MIELPQNVPPEGLQMVRSAAIPSLEWLASRLPPGNAVFLQVARPHPLFTASLPAFVQGEILSTARWSAWQYLILSGESAVASAELRIAEDGSLVFAALHDGPQPAELVAAIARAEQMPAVIAGHYELRILRAPALSIVALWLHGGADDLLFPLAPAPGGVDTDRVYSESELVDALHPLMESRERGSSLEPQDLV
jgi:hypothetical protein